MSGGSEMQRLRVGLELMQAEFESNQLEVVLAPSRRSGCAGCIRVAASRNCTWYRRFCARHASSRVRNRRLHDTRIKRRNVAALLARLRAEGTVRRKYSAELLGIARTLATGAAAESLLAQAG